MNNVNLDDLSNKIDEESIYVQKQEDISSLIPNSLKGFIYFDDYGYVSPKQKLPIELQNDYDNFISNYYNNKNNKIVNNIVNKIIDLPFDVETTIAELINYNPDVIFVSALTQGIISNAVHNRCESNGIKLIENRDEFGGLAFHYKFHKTNVIENENSNIEIPDNIKDKIYKILSHNTGMNENIKIRKVSDNLYFAFGLPDENGIDSVVIGLDMSYLCGDSSRGMNNLISEYNSGKRSEEFVLEKDESKVQGLEIDPIPYLEKLKTYSVEELKEEKHRLSNEAFSSIPQTDEGKQRKAMNIEYMKVIDKLLRTPRAQNEVVLSKIKDFIRFKDPREMYHYRQQDLEELSMYDDFKELPPKFKMWVDMAIREIYEDTKLAEMPFDTNNIPHLDINAMVKSIDKAIDMEKNNTHEQLTNSNVEEKANTNSSSMSNEELNNIFTNIDNFLSGSSERIRTPEETKLHNEKEDIRNRIELRNKLSKVITLYTDIEVPHVEIFRNNGQVYIDYPEDIINLRNYMLNSSYFNKDYNLDIQTIMNKPITTLTGEETLAYMYYVLKIEEQQYGYIANMINSNVFNMLCIRLFNYTYDLI